MRWPPSPLASLGNGRELLSVRVVDAGDFVPIVMLHL